MVPDLILLDIMLPGIQGLDVCRIIKSDRDTKNIPIILVSALGQEDDIVNGLEAGADDYIAKPFSNKILLAKLNLFYAEKWIRLMVIIKTTYTSVD